MGPRLPLHESHRHRYGHPDPLGLPQVHHLPLALPAGAGVLHALGRLGGHVSAAGREVRHEVLLRALRLGQILGHARHVARGGAQPIRHRRGLASLRREIPQFRRMVYQRRDQPRDSGCHRGLPRDGQAVQGGFGRAAHLHLALDRRQEGRFERPERRDGRRARTRMGRDIRRHPRRGGRLAPSRTDISTTTSWTSSSRSTSAWRTNTA